MPVPLTDDHLALAATVGSFATDRKLLAAARACLDTPGDDRPGFWAELGAMGWLGLHLPADVGGSGFGLLEAAVVAEQLGQAVAPGAFVPTVVVSALLDRHAPDVTRSSVLPGLADGTSVATFALDAQVELRGEQLHGDAGLVLCGAQADWLAIAVADDVALVDAHDGAVTITPEASLDPSRPLARVRCAGVAAVVLHRARLMLDALARLLFAAEASGVAGSCVDRAVAYAKIRHQFGRPIGSFQAVKHHCANMYVEAQLAAASTWAAGLPLPVDEAALAAATAATIAIPAARHNAELSIRVLGGIGFTWEEDAHLYLRRALAVAAVCDPERAAAAVTDATVSGSRVRHNLNVTADAAAYEAEVTDFLAGLADTEAAEQLPAIVAAGYAMPHWPAPWGRAASAVERLATVRAFEAAGIARPAYGITGWILYALLTHGTPEQVERWIEPGLLGREIWCQLFSEPEAGSDAAAVRTKATRADGGWRLSGEKIWTTRAHLARWGLATVRTDPTAPKHAGISTMAVDMKAPGVEVRPLRQLDGDDEFNEVRFDDVFIPDADVVGAIGDGWTVARATLAGESSSIGAGATTINVPLDMLLDLWRARPQRLAGGGVRLGVYLARTDAMAAINLRTTYREISGQNPGPEGSVVKLVYAENMAEGTHLLAQLAGPDGALRSGIGAAVSDIGLRWLAGPIAGGTSEIKRNQIGERVLGLPREPKIG
jgi:alkylation response protein AidB-like acyl-CoA dehydrogenase